LFSTTAADRVTLARRQLFEEGQRPTGLVSEAVIQSWMRCHRTHPDTRRPVAFDPVSASRLHAALERSRALLHTARAELQTMERALAGTGACVMLTNADGVVLYITPPGAVQRPLTRSFARLGVNLSEQRVGTSAPGIVARTGRACTVLGGEHYFEPLAGLRCAAAPIRDVHGRLAGVLDVTVEDQPFGFDAGAMVGLYATTIENDLLQSLSRDQLILRFQTSPSLLDTPLVGLAGVTSDGTVAWLNDAGARLLGSLPAEPPDRQVEDLLGFSLDALLRLCHGAPQPLQLASGLVVWASARLAAHGTALEAADAAVPDALAPAPAEAAPPAPPVAPVAPADAAATLREHHRQLIAQTLAAHGGNVTQAARQLGVSRGTLYRQLRQAGHMGKTRRPS
jgi:transcriptional regulator of acetoin/glycerol metabolism